MLLHVQRILWKVPKLQFNFCTLETSQINVINSIKSRISGNSQNPQYDIYRKFYNKSIDEVNIPGVTIVKDKKKAEEVVQILLSLPDRVHAWDTETTDLNVKIESAIGKGKMVCASAFCGPEVNFGNGPRLFVDNFAQNSDLIQVFKEYFENSKYKKIWHNYSFDRIIFHNHNIDVKGFGGDTMHLARLNDPSRMPGEYSLASLTRYHNSQIEEMKRTFLEKLRLKYDKRSQQGIALDIFEQNFLNDSIKKSMTDIFGLVKEGYKVRVFPTIIQMHCNSEYIEKWINYSTLDAESTYFLFYTLVNLLRDTPTILGFKDKPNSFQMKNLLDIYKTYWRPFGEILTDMEREGMCIDAEHAKSIVQRAQNDILQLEKDFKEWVQSTQNNDVSQFNPASLKQLQQLIFAPWERELQKTKLAKLIEDSPLMGEIIEQENEDDGYYSDGRKKPVRRVDPNFPEVKVFKVDNVEFTIRGLGIKPTEFTASGLPSCDIAALKKLVGSKGEDGFFNGAISEQLEQSLQQSIENAKQSYQITINNRTLDDQQKRNLEQAHIQQLQSIQQHHTENRERSQRMCQALQKLIELRSLETLNGTFITPLVELVSQGYQRVHCNLNINTETGRLSSRNPNMQNQPALEKDIYQIRRSFKASPGKQLIVADYGQLELRVLAHMTNCKTMIEAFKMGGDFHSRTAISMYPEIKREIDQGRLLLEKDKTMEDQNIPLLKEKYASERRKAKTMNFSIAYGKTQSGFAREWGISMQEAKMIIDLWYKDRPEVRQWQEETKITAERFGYSQTLLGRYRNTSKYFMTKGLRDSYYWHGKRASINTPIQGGAADIVIGAMVRIGENEILKDLGWKLILQVHDELILEGPSESSREALKHVRYLMENPFEGHQLRLRLEVDAKIGNNWYECK